MVGHIIPCVLLLSAKVLNAADTPLTHADQDLIDAGAAKYEDVSLKETSSVSLGPEAF